MSLPNTPNPMNKEEKLALLSTYFADEVCIRAIKDTLSEQELLDWIDSNLNELLAKQI